MKSCRTSSMSTLSMHGPYEHSASAAQRDPSIPLVQGNNSGARAKHAVVNYSVGALVCSVDSPCAVIDTSHERLSSDPIPCPTAIQSGYSSKAFVKATCFFRFRCWWRATRGLKLDAGTGRRHDLRGSPRIPTISAATVPAGSSSCTSAPSSCSGSAKRRHSVLGVDSGRCSGSVGMGQNTGVP